MVKNKWRNLEVHEVDKDPYLIKNAYIQSVDAEVIVIRQLLDKGAMKETMFETKLVSKIICRPVDL